MGGRVSRQCAVPSRPHACIALSAVDHRRRHSMHAPCDRWWCLGRPGGGVLAAGLAQAGIIGKAQAATIIIGLLLLINPDIEIISAAGAVLLCAGYMPLGIRELRGKLSFPAEPES